LLLSSTLLLLIWTSIYDVTRSYYLHGVLSFITVDSLLLQGY